MTPPQIVRVLTLSFVLAGITPSAIAADVFSGREVYVMHCEACHGADGRSTDPGSPDFSNGDAMVQPDTYLYSKIRNGTATMPAYRGILNDAEVRNVIAYLRSLQK